MQQSIKRKEEQSFNGSNTVLLIGFFLALQERRSCTYIAWFGPLAFTLIEWQCITEWREKRKRK